MEIFTIGKLGDRRRFLPHWAKKVHVGVVESNPCCVGQKIRELWSTNKKLQTQMLTHPKLTVRAILNNFRVWSRISPERVKKSTIGNKLDRLLSLPRWTKKMANCGPLTKKKDVDAP